ncbi:MAG: hypothetical protein M3220_06835 [Chloroflexota bacterium]|nr:hypothetical protein [Chloroflexota bacterium]
MDSEARLQRAEEHIFSTALLDSGARLGLANMCYGLAKIHWVQEQMGLPANATYVAAPDCTVTRNRTRWRSGFGYGGILTWGEGDQDLIILDSKPNACGMIVGGLDEVPPMKDLIKRVHELGHDNVEIDGVPIEWDFGLSNHFIDLFRIEPLVDVDLPPYAFMMHFAGDELRGETSFGPGLYWDKSPALRERMRLFDTPFGPLRVLTRDDARGYYEFYQKVESFVHKRRLYAADRLFDTYELINNDTHQGLTNPNQLLLGCYSFTDSNRLYAIGLRPDLPAYLVRGKPSLSQETIENLGFEKRAQRLEVYDRLTSANVLPHGGGYAYPDILGVADVYQIDGERYFEVDFANGRGRQVISAVRDLPYEYRGRKVVLRAVELGLAELVARLMPEYILKV